MAASDAASELLTRLPPVQCAADHSVKPDRATLSRHHARCSGFAFVFKGNVCSCYADKGSGSDLLQGIKQTEGQLRVMVCTEGLLTNIEVLQNVPCTQTTEIDLHILTCLFAIVGHDEEHSPQSERMRRICCLLDITKKRRF
jgi:hypothetical protein